MCHLSDFSFWIAKISRFALKQTNKADNCSYFFRNIFFLFISGTMRKTYERFICNKLYKIHAAINSASSNHLSLVYMLLAFQNKFFE
jgi:hypothetical protein